MTPQIGDIWKYHNPQRDWDDCLALLGLEHFSHRDEIIFWGYDMLTDQYDEFLFCETNMGHWEKVA